MKIAMCRYTVKVGILATLLAVVGAWSGGAAVVEEVAHIIMPDLAAGGGAGRIIRRTYPDGVVVTNQAGAVQYIQKGGAGGNGLCISPDGQWLVVPGNETWDGVPGYVVQIWQKSTNAFGWTLAHWYKEVTLPANTPPKNPWIRGAYTFAACSPDSKYVWLVDQVTTNLVRLTLTNDCTYDTNDVARGTTQAKGLPDIVVNGQDHLVEPRQIVFGPGNGHDYQDMYIANGSGTNVVVYDGTNGTYIKTINLPAGLGVTNWVGAVLADASYLYVLAGQKNQNKNCHLLKYNCGASSYTTPLINGNTNEFADVWYMQWAPGGNIVYSAMTPGWSYTVNEFNPRTSEYRRYFAPLGGAVESQTFTFYVPSAIFRGTMIMMQ